MQHTGAYLFFVRPIGGKWEYKFKLWTKKQIDFYSDLYMRMRNERFAYDPEATDKYAETCWCDLVLEKVTGYECAETKAIDKQLQKLNAMIPATK